MGTPQIPVDDVVPLDVLDHNHQDHATAATGPRPESPRHDSGGNDRGDVVTTGDAPERVAAATPPARQSHARRGNVAVEEGATQRAPTATVRLSAADIVEDRLLKPTSSPPTRGWRRVVYRLTGGLVRLRPGRVELEQRTRVATVKTSVAGSRVIATVSTKGGVGKTTTTVNLGHTFAALRGDRVVALDGNPDAGSLGFRIRSETTATAATLLGEIDTVARYADMRAYTSQADSRLEIVAAPADPRVSTALGEADYRRLLGLLEAHYQLILVDCGTGILDDATRGIVEHADQLVVVTAPSVDAARATSYLLDWLDSHGHHHLVDQAVTVINGCRADTGLIDLDEIEGHFAARCRTVVRVPWDAHLAAGASTGLDALATATHDAYVEVAAAVAHGFTPTNSTMEEAS